jgi:hypothetical protein
MLSFLAYMAHIAHPANLLHLEDPLKEKCNLSKEKILLDQWKNLTFVQKCTHNINFHTLNFLVRDTCAELLQFENKIQGNLRER